MPKITTITCDSCEAELDMKKNFFTIVGQSMKFHPDKGPYVKMTENYYCHVCSDKIINLIEELEQKTTDIISTDDSQGETGSV